MTKDEALLIALEALEVANSLVDAYYLPKEKAWLPEIEEAITAIKAVQEAKDEPVANSSSWFALVMNAAAELEDASHCLRDEDAKQVAIRGAKYYREQAHALYTTPPQRKPLTDEEINNLDKWLEQAPYWRVLKLARAIEAAHGIS